MRQFVSEDYLGDLYAKGRIPKTVLNTDLLFTYPSMPRNPVACGMLVTRYRTLMQHFSTGVLIQWRPVIRTLHLYNAARMEFPALVPKCPDFEPFTSIHTDAKIFISARPTNSKEYVTVLSTKWLVKRELCIRCQLFQAERFVSIVSQSPCVHARTASLCYALGSMLCRFRWSNDTYS